MDGLFYVHFTQCPNYFLKWDYALNKCLHVISQIFSDLNFTKEITKELKSNIWFEI